MDVFDFRAHDHFLNRSGDLARMEDWWSGSERNALALYGRRRVGKSWLFREFAHGKPALVLVADRRAETPQLDRFARRLEPFMGVRPSLDSVPALIEALYTLAADEKRLVVVDEFPYLLPAREKDRDHVLTQIQAVMEERDSSQLKLVVCGSYISQMERLLRGPLRGRLTAIAITPLPFRDAQQFLASDTAAVERIERDAVAGGMSLHLDELARGGTLRERICERVLNSRGPLFNDPREVLEEELRSPGIYYSLLEELATGKRAIARLGSLLGRSTSYLQPYLDTLREMQIVERSAPITAVGEERGYRYGLADDFMRFWFRFVFPFQDELKTGLAPRALYDGEIADALADHVSPTFERLCREWARHSGAATRVGSWWGNALNELRRDGARETEEIDVVGLTRAAVTLVGECKWTRRPMGIDVLADLETLKIPALRQAGVRVARDVQIVLFSKAGFTDALKEAADAREDVRLIDAERLVNDLLGG